MQTNLSKLAIIGASVAVVAVAFTLPAAARVRHEDGYRRIAHRPHHRIAARPLTVHRRFYREPVVVAAPDPFHGPQSIITAPVTIAGTIVGLPFRALGTVFPPYGSPATNPLVLVGAPLYAAGRVAQFPFYAVDSAFGVAPGYY